MSRTKPTGDQINAEIATLREVKPHIPKRNRLGEENRNGIEAQIHVLEAALTVSQVHDCYGEANTDADDFCEHALMVALAAANWRAGDTGESPATGWQEYLPHGCAMSLAATNGRGLSFAPPMATAIIEDRKTMTRRLVGPQPEAGTDSPYHVGKGDRRMARVCPYGSVGDRLYVREEHYRFGHWELITDEKTKNGLAKWEFVADSLDGGDMATFDAPPEFRRSRNKEDSATPAWHKRLARFMPRKFSRLTLEITDIKIERLHDIGAKDILAEGAVLRSHDNQFGRNPVSSFDGKVYLDLVSLWAAGWTQINGDYSWAGNPYVWVISFKRVSA